MNPTWQVVALALIAAIPGIIAAFYAHRNTKQLDTGPGKPPIGLVAASVTEALATGNDKTVGEMVTEVHGVTSVEKTPFETHGAPPDTGP